MKPSLKVSVIERDFCYKVASTVLSAGGVRQQFSVKENILLSQLTMEILKHPETYLDIEAAELQFVEEGYAMLAGTESGASVISENHRLQSSLGADISLLDRKGLQKKFSWMNCDDVELGAVGNTGEGWFDPWSLLTAVQRKNKSMGVDYINGEVTRLNVVNDVIQSVQVSSPQGNQFNINCDTLVNSAGAYSNRIARMAGVSIPVEPRPRSIYAVHCPDSLADASLYCPLVVDYSGVWFRRESIRGSGMFLCGLSPSVENDTCVLPLQATVADIQADLANHLKQEYFDEHIWPVLAHRVPAFENLKVKSAWSGLYDYNTFDQNALIGKHPDLDNFFIVSGFSGHGLQQGPAAGRAISELIHYGEFQSIDLSIFDVSRVKRNKPVFERNIV